MPDTPGAVPDLFRLAVRADEPGRQATGQPEAAPPRPGRVPAGPREPATGADWVRAAVVRRRL